MTDRGNKGYIPWHERINEELVKQITTQFVDQIFREAGMRVHTVRVNWSEDGKEFDCRAYGKPIGQPPPD